MYISYGFSVINVLIVGVALFYLAGDPPLWVYFWAITIVTILLTPLMFRYTRVLMLYLFGSVSYDPKHNHA